MTAEKQYKVIVSEKAYDTLSKIISYIALDSIEAAVKVKNEISKAMASLSKSKKRNIKSYGFTVISAAKGTVFGRRVYTLQQIPQISGNAPLPYNLPVLR